MSSAHPSSRIQVPEDVLHDNSRAPPLEVAGLRDARNRDRHEVVPGRSYWSLLGDANSLEQRPMVNHMRDGRRPLVLGQVLPISAGGFGANHVVTDFTSGDQQDGGRNQRPGHQRDCPRWVGGDRDPNLSQRRRISLDPSKLVRTGSGRVLRLMGRPSRRCRRRWYPHPQAPPHRRHAPVGFLRTDEDDSKELASGCVAEGPNDAHGSTVTSQECQSDIASCDELARYRSWSARGGTGRWPG